MGRASQSPPPFWFSDAGNGVVPLHRGATRQGKPLVRLVDLARIAHVGPRRTFAAIGPAHQESGAFPTAARGGTCHGLDRAGIEAFLAVIPHDQHGLRVAKWLEAEVYPHLAAPEPEPRRVEPEPESPPTGREVARVVDVEMGEHLLRCIPGGGPKDWSVILKPTCEAMGLDYSAQWRRLQREHWATVAITATVDSAGKTRDMVTIDRPTFKMWLVKLTASRIKDDEARARIERFQVEAMDVIDLAFDDDLGRRDPDFPSSARQSNELLMAKLLHEMFSRLERLEARPDPAPAAPPTEYDRGHVVLREVPPGYHRFSAWIEGEDFPRELVSYKRDVNIAFRLSASMGKPVYRIRPEGDWRGPAFYFHEAVLKKFSLIFRQRHPVWSTSPLPFPPDSNGHSAHHRPR